MAPTKSARPMLTTISTRTTAARNKTKAVEATNVVTKQPRVKRKADASPVKESAAKRSALGNITNVTAHCKLADIKAKVVAKSGITAIKKATVQLKQLPSVKTVIKPKQNENVAPPVAPVPKVQTRASFRNLETNHTAQKPKEPVKENNRVKTRLSNEFEKTEDSLYSSALEDVDVSTYSSAGPPATKPKCSGTENRPSNVSLVAEQLEAQLNLGNHDVPDGINDFDKENWDDIFQVSQYTMDIFNYFRTREPLFAIKDYMDQQVCLTRWMRSLLVDWMVEIQESFELNHETLYLGVKLVDIYLSKVMVSKETLQLVGVAGMFIASKYDERIPPQIEDFLYICDGAYTQKELIRMELNLLKICDFELGLPLSYRFLRRYARCAKVTMPVLTLARFILEYSLMDYATVMITDSKLAAAALYLALQMKHVGGWNATLEFYSGYTLDQILSIVHLLNNGLHRKPKEPLMTVRNKYSHKIFFEVAKTPLIKNEELQL